MVRKFGNDQAGSLAALVAYYAFFSLFPLLLVFVTVLGYVLERTSAQPLDVLASALFDRAGLKTGLAFRPPSEATVAPTEHCVGFPTKTLPRHLR